LPENLRWVRINLLLRRPPLPARRTNGGPARFALFGIATTGSTSAPAHLARGTWMQSAAQQWLVLKLTNSSLMLGVVSFAQFQRILLVGLFAGVIVDRVDRRRLIVTTRMLLMISAFVLAVTWSGGVE
jgi:MFS family permease